jgi:hypothetical protein
MLFHNVVSLLSNCSSWVLIYYVSLHNIPGSITHNITPRNMYDYIISQYSFYQLVLSTKGSPIVVFAVSIKRALNIDNTTIALRNCSTNSLVSECLFGTRLIHIHTQDKIILHNLIEIKSNMF